MTLQKPVLTGASMLTLGFIIVCSCGYKLEKHMTIGIIKLDNISRNSLCKVMELPYNSNGVA